MINRTLNLCASLLMLAVLTHVAHSNDMNNVASVCKIGIYDSRVIALAYYRSEQQMARLQAIRTEHMKAKSENNQDKIKELEKEGPWTQVRMHQQVFSTAGISHITTQIQEPLKQLAQDAGVIIIISKWEMPYLAATAEIIDLTVPIAKLFNPDEQTLKIMEAMKIQEPVPFDQLPLDPNF